jgi:type I restriction enzyme S subunit
MSGHEKKPLVPRLRFPEFREEGEWAKKSLADVCLRITNGKANAEDHEEDGVYPLFDRSEVIKKSSDFAFDDEAVIIPGEGMRFQPKYYQGKFNLHQRAYALMQHKGVAKFVYYTLDRFKDTLAKNAVKSTVLSLRLPIIEKFGLAVPNKGEQQKIADCLSSLDDLITAETQKLDTLKTHKKGLMQQLFPREGEAVPRLRFPEFREAGEWEKVSLQRVIEIASGQVDPTKPPYCDLPHVGGENIEAGTGKLLNLRTAKEDGVISGKYAFDEHDILYSKIRPALNKVAAPDISGVCSADVYPIRPCCEMLRREFLVYLLRSESFVKYATKHSGRGKIPKINREDLFAYDAMLPTPAEQEYIASFLSSLDERINLQSQKLEDLQNHKIGLMQQLFPALDEVDA